MKKLWVICIDADGTSSLKEGTKYLIEPRGTKAKVIISEHNPKYVLGNWVKRSRFKQIETGIIPNQHSFCCKDNIEKIGRAHYRCVACHRDISLELALFEQTKHEDINIIR